MFVIAREGVKIYKKIDHLDRNLLDVLTKDSLLMRVLSDVELLGWYNVVTPDGLNGYVKQDDVMEV